MTNFCRSYGSFLAVALIVTSLISIGCEKAASEKSIDGDTQVAKSLPASALSFHKPKDVKTAVSRMRELHEAISSGKAMPDPIEYQVQEVIHGTGAGGHSHYYLYDPDNPVSESDHHEDHDHHEEDESDHDHVTSDEKIHDVTIGPFVELRDLAKWLPKIASNSDMPESDWLKVNDASKEMTSMLNKIVEQSTDDEKRLSSYKEQADSMSGYISSLETLNK